MNLAAAFVQVLKDFGVEEKVSSVRPHGLGTHNPDNLEILTFHQILGVTCDNALNNDTMVNALEVEVPSFRGQNARTRCFDHVVNLVAKALTRQFDHKKGDSRRSDDDLEVDLESEELAARFELYKELGGEGDDDEEGLLDELSSMSEADRVAYLESVQPVRMVLVKVCSSFHVASRHRAQGEAVLVAQGRFQDRQFNHTSSAVVEKNVG